MTKAILQHDTFLFSAEAPTGRLFGAGELHPGDGWGDEPVAAAPTSDAGETGANPVQAALDEQRAKFDEAWADLTKEHDKALVDLEKANAENADLRGEIASKDEDIRQLKEAIAKFDPDGDGKPGGSKPKAAS